MSGYMTAAQHRDLLLRSMRPRPSHITPELRAAQIAATQQDIDSAREYMAETAAQGRTICGAFGASEVRRLEMCKAYWEGDAVRWRELTNG